MSVRRSGRRRGLALLSMAIFALSLTLAVPGMVSGASANIAVPGQVQVTMDLSVLTPTLTLSGFYTQKTAPATIASNGTIRVPRAGIVFQPVNVTVAPSDSTIGDVTVQLVASSDLTGSVNPATHVESLSGSFEMVWSQPPAMTGCHIGPFDVHLTTTSVGARPYAQTSGTATAVDGNFAIDALAPATPGCGGLEDAVNAALSLPITTTTTTSGSTTTTSTTTTTTPSSTLPAGSLPPDVPRPAVVLSMRISPAPRAPQAPISQPTPTTAHPVLTSPPTTSASRHHPVTTAHPPTTARKKSGGTSPKRSVPKHVKQNRLKKHHKRRHLLRRHLKHHKKHHATLSPKTGTTRRLPVRRAATAPLYARSVAPSLFGASANRYRALARRATRATAPTAFNPTLVSSRHRAAPSPLNFLAMLALAVSGAYAIKLMSPDFNDLRRARSRRRGRLYGIDPPATDA